MAGTLRIRRTKTLGFFATKWSTSLILSAAPKKNGPLTS